KNNEKLKEMSVQYKDKPERLKEIKEITGKSYREYINYKNNLKRQFGIYLREDIEEKRSNLVEQIEKKESQLPNTIEQLQKIIFLYLKILENTYPEIFSYEEIEKGKKKINKYFEFLKDLKNISVIEGEKIIQEVKRKEFTFYELLENFLNEIEKEIFKNYAPDYIEIEKEYEKTLREYERLQNKYTEELNIAREEYEKERSKYEEEWKKIREDMEKSPEEFKEIYEKLLEKYKKPWEEEHRKVVELGGLHIIGSERYEARRIDNQLKGRAGRQGDPGSSKFYLSLEDDLLRIFGGERLKAIMGKLPEGEKITHPLITKMINNAQKKVEARNFEIRKNLLEFDNVLNEQRNIIYSLRQDILENRNIDEYLKDYIDEIIENISEEYLNQSLKPHMWNIEGFIRQVKAIFGINFSIENFENIQNYFVWKDNLKEKIKNTLLSILEAKRKQIGDFFDEVKRFIFLQVIDNRWKAHLRAMDELREGISLRAYAQKDPLIAYKHEAFIYFNEMLRSIKEEIIGNLMKIQITEKVVLKEREIEKKEFVHPEYESFASKEPVSALKSRKIGRNQPCPCGSGKKYKHCCGKNV
ncbi:MAG: SEC-C metal-binding domain-containing protein, partial [Candidatus Ratteibacteria bacterium]